MAGQIGESGRLISHMGKRISCLGLSLLVLKLTVLVREACLARRFGLPRALKVVSNPGVSLSQVNKKYRDLSSSTFICHQIEKDQTNSAKVK